MQIFPKKNIFMDKYVRSWVWKIMLPVLWFPERENILWQIKLVSNDWFCKIPATKSLGKMKKSLNIFPIGFFQIFKKLSTINPAEQSRSMPMQYRGRYRISDTTYNAISSDQQTRNNCNVRYAIQRIETYIIRQIFVLSTKFTKKISSQAQYMRSIAISKWKQ